MARRSRPLRVRRRRPYVPDKADTGTPETEAKRIPDAIHGLPGVVDELGKAKFPGLAPELREAAAAIDRAYCRLCAKLLSRAASVERADGTGRESEYGRGDLVLILRYQAWMRTAAARKLPTDALIDMIIDGDPPQICDWRYRRKPGSHAKMLEAGLRLYLQIDLPDLERRLAQTGDQKVA